MPGIFLPFGLKTDDERIKAIDWGVGSISVEVSLFAAVPMLECVDNLGFVKIFISLFSYVIHSYFRV